MDPNNISTGKNPKSFEDLEAQLAAAALVQQQFGVTGLNTQDTMASAGISSLTSSHPLSASQPALDPSLVAYEMQMKMDEIVIKMLTSWGEALAEQAEQKRKELTDPNYLNQLASEQIRIKEMLIQQQTAMQANQNPVAGLDSLRPIDFNDQVHNDLKRTLSNGLIEVGSELSKGKVSSTEGAAILGSAIILAAGLGFAGLGAAPQTVSISSPASSLSINPMTEAVQHFGAVMPPDMRAELGLMGALFGLSAMGTAAFPVVAENKAGHSQSEKTLAQNYADQVLKMVKGTAVDGFLASVFDKKGTLSEQQITEQVAIQKVILMSTAVAALYIGIAGGITSQELQNLIRNPQLLDNPELKFTDQEKELVPLINKEMSKLTPSQRQRLEQAIGDYIDSKPKFESLLDLNKVLEGIAERADFHNNAGPV